MPTDELSTDVPPEIATLLPENAQSELSKLLGTAMEFAPLSSITVRLADWHQRRLYRVAVAGIQSPFPEIDTKESKGINAYLYRNADKYSVISLPSTDQTVLRALAQAAYPDLSYLPGRESTRSQYCILLRGANRTPLGTLNIEADEESVPGIIRPLLVTLSNDIEAIIRFRSEYQELRRSEILQGANAFIAHALHEVKNTLFQLAKRCSTYLDSSSDDNTAAEIDSIFKTGSRNILDELEDLAQVPRLEIIDLGELMRKAQDDIRQYAEDISIESLQVTIQLPDNCPTVRGSAKALASGVCLNSSHSSNKGGKRKKPFCCS